MKRRTPVMALFPVLSKPAVTHNTVSPSPKDDTNLSQHSVRIFVCALWWIGTDSRAGWDYASL